MSTPLESTATARLEPSDDVIPPRFRYENLVLMVHRMQLGLLLYPAIWMLLVVQEGHLRSQLDTAVGHGVALLVITAIRYLAHGQLLALGEAGVDRARRTIAVMSMLHNLYWGVLCAMVFASPNRDDQAWMTLIATVGITAGGTVITASDPFIPRYYALATLGPTFVALLPQWSWTTAGIEGLVMLVVLYSRSLAKIAGRDHKVRIQAQIQLEQRAIELEALSRTDALTRIANRLSFEEQFHTAWRQALRRREPLAIAIVDLDHFKRINDGHGHPFGDRCLVAAAQAIQAEARRPGDLAARYGGEEFVLLMPNTDIQGAMHVAEAVLQRVRNTVVGEATEAQVTLSCSIGVASCLPGGADNPRLIIQEADKALYEAKSRGRARVHTLDPAGRKTSPLASVA
ncbi:MAG: hypothetical protein RI907_1291 [Pseudomonadota bacterium]|jgi:diguanylate cyclase (GGDEF)-like protein